MPTVQELEVAGHHITITTPDHMVPLNPADYDGVDAYEAALHETKPPKVRQPGRPRRKPRPNPRPSRSRRRSSHPVYLSKSRTHLTVSVQRVGGFGYLGNRRHPGPISPGPLTADRRAVPAMPRARRDQCVAPLTRRRPRVGLDASDPLRLPRRLTIGPTAPTLTVDRVRMLPVPTLPAPAVSRVTPAIHDRNDTTQADPLEDSPTPGMIRRDG